MEYRYIVIEGNIGAGKTTLAEKMASQYQARLVLEEFAENPFLPPFYKDPERYSFSLELSFLAERYQQLKLVLEQNELFRQTTIADYYFVKCMIFARQNLKGDEYKLFRQLYDIVLPSVPRPDLYVYLHLPVERLLENIRKRGRSYEQSISADYLKSIQDGYFDYFTKNDQLCILIIDTSAVDFARNEKDYQKIRRVIMEGSYQKGVNRIIL